VEEKRGKGEKGKKHLEGKKGIIRTVIYLICLCEYIPSTGTEE